VTALFSVAAIAEAASTVHLTVADATGKILQEKSQNLQISGNQASGTLKLDFGSISLM